MDKSIGKKTGDIVLCEEDLAYEEEILRNPYSVKHWLRYCEFKKDAPPVVVNLIYERALKEMPGSYKLWYSYLCLRRKQTKGRCITDPLYEDANNTFERALVFMHKMPRIWMDYCKFLTLQQKITTTRKVFDRALRALPITQHSRIWPLYLKFVKMHPIPETAVRVFRRFLKLSTEDAEEFVDYLKSIDRLDEAAVKLAQIVNKDSFVSKTGKSNHQLWNELCELNSKNPKQIKSLNVDAIIRGGLRRYTDQLGQLWNSLADYYIRSGLFERARDIYEEAIQTVTTVRDFTQVFDAYAQFEELNLNHMMEEIGQKPNPTEDDDIEVELRMARFEDLMDRRPLLLNSVLLRQNPHNVAEWHKRVQLYEGKPHEVINTFTEAVQTVDPKQAIGKVHTLWVDFAKFYEKNDQIDDSRIVFEKATHVKYVKVDELATVWCEWAEMEIRNSHFQEALKLMHRVTTPPARKINYHDDAEQVQTRVHKSLKIWGLYADLEESFGTFKTCKAVYDRILELKIATPQIIMNYAIFLEENNYFEEAFKAYERGVALFKWPNVYDIWNTYLSKFLKRYGGSKLERARDLFEQCLEGCPNKFAKTFFMLYAKLEEEHGLARHAMNVYERATKAVPANERFDMYNMYIKKASEIYGVTKTRHIYERSIEELPDHQAREMCLRFADLERKLGEIDRARAVYGHCSQMCDPRVAPEFWKVWKEFEIRHGNEDTMREMLRIKRSVQATYNTQINMMSAQMLAAATNTAEAAAASQDSMKMLDAEAEESRPPVPVAKPLARAGSNIMFVRSETQPGSATEDIPAAAANPDEIDIDQDGDDDEEEEEATIEEQQVPRQVFGSLKKDEEDEEEAQ
ncbi:pre-mRNA-splicing factor syf1 homolog [Daphnia pulex]|uniref:pre-mRNA-splicing factor syf1 homolog n=1 Tax=Daphnia pulex TaxID=6669 RepID=UPI001EDF4435|nr:pre-mRNA-splicing factor syf1 homolog [Daphnia pulex]